MTVPLIIVSPEFPPRKGGLVDHTVELARALSANREVIVLTSSGCATGDDFRVCPTVGNWQSPKAVLSAISQLPLQADILWQYVPHMYGRGGVNPGLAVVIRNLSHAGRVQCLIAHEIVAGLSWWPNRVVYALAHRFQWRQILKHIDVIGISTEAWLEEWCLRTPAWRRKFFLAPSPSNIEVIAIRQDHARDWRGRTGLEGATRVIAYFGTLSRFKQFAWLLTAWVEAQTTTRKVGLVIVGDRPSAPVPDCLKPLFKPLGYLPAAEVSAALQAVDLLGLPFVDGVSERRGSFMAGLSHGCPVVTTLGASTGSTLRQAEFFSGIGADQKQGFVDQVSTLLADDALRLKFGQAGRKAYEQRYAWPKLIETVEEKLTRIRRLRTAP